MITSNPQGVVLTAFDGSGLLHTHHYRLKNPSTDSAEDRDVKRRQSLPDGHDASGLPCG